MHLHHWSKTVTKVSQITPRPIPYVKDHEHRNNQKTQKRLTEPSKDQCHPRGRLAAGRRENAGETPPARTAARSRPGRSPGRAGRGRYGQAVPGSSAVAEKAWRSDLTERRRKGVLAALALPVGLVWVCQECRTCGQLVHTRRGAKRRAVRSRSAEAGTGWHCLPSPAPVELMPPLADAGPQLGVWRLWPCGGTASRHYDEIGGRVNSCGPVVVSPSGGGMPGWM